MTRFVLFDQNVKFLKKINVCHVSCHLAFSLVYITRAKDQQFYQNCGFTNHMHVLEAYTIAVH